MEATDQGAMAPFFFFLGRALKNNWQTLQLEGKGVGRSTLHSWSVCPGRSRIATLNTETI